ncbi:hypothetical protein C2E25_11505 [Geothermobacter hydrogeniphilus]|uniref:Fibronectin type-III domain-containing protein n=1 Tax=Geothermobacter hydrogeniphilus TaxID=1969733 RepID=A0A2K2H8J3_9BACT|nr:DUF2341 domain-containing protein [Geothermobacter hydrogeniphilus]PNU19642.1 hypothetical protein C2E25_11505 [Geothermobacter hydrogeniphilus]
MEPGDTMVGGGVLKSVMFRRRLSILHGFVVLLMVVGTCSPVVAAGGELRPGWPWIESLAGDQMAADAVVDDAGDLVLVGSSNGAGRDLVLLKVKGDGSGAAWPMVSYDYAGGEDAATAVAIAPGGDIIVTGYVHNGSDFDILTARYRGTDGTLMWRHIYDGPSGGDDYPTAVVLDALGNIYVGGYVQGQGNKDDALVMKFSPDGPEADGKPLWTYLYNGPAGGHDRLTALAAGVDGLALTGESESAVAGDFDAFTMKVDYSGSPLWPQAQRYTDSGNGRGNAVAVDAEGDVVMLGHVAGSSDPSGRDLFLIKYPAVYGPAVWVDHYDGGFEDEGLALVVTAAGDIFIAGRSFTTSTAFDIYLARYSAAGVMQWSDLRNSSNGNNDVPVRVLAGLNGDLYVLGYNNDAQGGFDDITLCKYRQSGAFLWQTSYDGNGRNDRPVGIGLAPDGDLLVAGWSDQGGAGNPDFDLLALRYDAGRVDPPTALAATVVSNSQIHLQWQNNDPSAETVSIEVRTATGIYTPVASLPASANSYEHTGLNGDTRYFYRVQAIRSGVGASPYSNEASARTTLISYDPPTWQYRFAGAAGGDDEPAAIACGPDLQPAVTGTTFSPLEGYDYLTIKLDRGNPSTELWQARYNDGDNQGDAATAIVVDSRNRPLVTGYASLWGGGASNTNDIYTLGYPAAGGSPLWTDQYNGPAGDDDKSLAIAVAGNPQDEAAVIGYGKNAAWNDDVYLLKYDPDGSRSWAALPWDGGGEDFPAAVAFAPDGRIFVGGRSFNGSSDDLLLLCYDGTDGRLLWQAVLDGPAAGSDRVVDLAVDAAGDLYVAATSERNVGDGDIYLAKFSGAGDGLPDGTGVAGAQLLWQQWYGSAVGYDAAVGVAIDPADGALLLGGTVLTAPGNHDLLLVRLDPAGDGAGGGREIWRHRLDLPDDEIGTAMSIDRSGILTLIATVSGGGWDDMLAVQWNHLGDVVAATRYDSPDGLDDTPIAVTTNRVGETFVAGSTLNGNGDLDLLVFRLPSPVLQAPDDLRATQLYSEVQLNWFDIVTGEDGFQLQRALGDCESPGSFVALADLPAGSESYFDSGLNIGSSYCYRLRSTTTSGDASRWVDVSVQTAAAVAPGQLTAVLQNESDILLTWIDNTPGASGYEFVIERCSGSGCDFSTMTSFTVDAATVVDSLTGLGRYIDSTACAGDVYRYRVFARKPGLWSTAYSQPTGTAGVAPQHPQAPSALSADRVSETGVAFSWQDNTAAEEQFLIERCDDIAANCSDTSFTPLATLPSLAGVQLLYRMDESAWNGLAGEVVDSSGNGNHGRSVNAATVPYGRYRRSGHFANDSRISTPLTIDQSSASSGAAFAAWVKPDAGSGQFFLFDSDNGGNDWSLLHDGATWQLNTGAESGPIDTGIAVDVGAWQQVVASFDPQGGVSFFKNGSDQFSDPGIGFDTSSAPLQVGYQDNPAGTLLQLHMDEAGWSDGSAGVVDSSGAGLDGTSYGGADTTTGHSGRAGQFDGVDDYVSTPLLIDQSASSAGVTMEAWVYPTDTSSYSWRHLLSTDNNSNEWGILQYHDQWRVATGNSLIYVGTVDLNRWQHLVAVFDPGKGVVFYKNGVPSTPQSIGYGTSNYFTIGRDAGSNSAYYKGLVDEVTVFDRPLTAAEVLDRYQRRSFQGQVDEVAVFNRPLSLSEAATLYQQGLARFNDSGTDVNRDYTYRVRADRAGSCAADWPTAPSAGLEVLTVPPAPDLQVQVEGDGRVRLSWVSRTTTQTGFKVERCEGTGCGSFITLDNSLGATADAYLDTTTCSGQTYRYRVTALQTPGWGESSPSAAVEVDVPALAAPSSLAVTGVSEGEISLQWSYPWADADRFEVGWCATAGGCSQPSDFTLSTVSGLPEGDLLWLRMNEAGWNNGTADVLDSSGHDRNTTSYNGLNVAAGGHSGGAGAFDGNDDYLQTPLHLDQGASGPGASFEVWVYPTRRDNSQRHVISTENGGYDWSLVQSLNNWMVFTGNTSYNTGLKVDFDQWQQLVVTFDPQSGVRVYKNGGLSPADVFTTSNIGFDASTSDLVIGRRASSTYSGYHFEGRIDEVVVYQRPLSAQEVQDRYLHNYTLTLGTFDPASEYSFDVRALRSDSCASSGPLVEIATPVSTDPVSAPVGLTANSVGTTRVDLNWSLATTTETLLTFERCSGLGSACDEDAEFSDFSPSVTLPGGSLNYSDLTVCAESAYTYRLRSERDSVPIWQSGWMTAERQALTIAPPLNFAAAGLSESEISLAWDGGEGDSDEYLLQRCVGSGFNCPSPTEIGRFSGARLLLHMDEPDWNGSAGEILDASGNGNHGSRVGTATTAAGRFDRSGSFNGSSSVQTPLLLDQSATGGGATFSVWAYPTVSDNSYRYLFSSENGGYDWGLSHRNGVWYIDTGEGRRSTGVAVDLNQWQLLSVTFTPGVGCTLMKNDGLAAEDQFSTTLIGYDGSSAALVIGKRANATGTFFIGRIDEVAIYDRSLDAAELRQFFNQPPYRFFDTGLDPATGYAYRLTAAKSVTGGCGWSKASDAAAATLAPPLPDQFAVVAGGTTWVDLAWQDKSGSETEYQLQRCDGSLAGCGSLDANFTALDVTMAPDSEAYSDASLCPGQIYSYRLRARRSSGLPLWDTGWVYLETTTATVAELTGFSAVRISEVEVDLGWNDTNQDEDKFVIERCIGAGCSNFAPIADLASSATVLSYRDDELEPGSTYNYRVNAVKAAVCNGGWQTGYQGPIEIAASIQSPKLVSATAVNTTRIDLAWNNNAPTATGTLVERCSGHPCQDSFVPVGTAVIGATGFTDDTACAGASYSYRLKSLGEGLSAAAGGCWSRRVPLTFDAFVPGSVVELAVPYDSDMRSDFADLRFYDRTARRELAYWIVEVLRPGQADAVARVLLETGNNAAIDLYYGNPNAADAGRRDRFVFYREDFTGQLLNPADWVELDADNYLEADNGLHLYDLQASYAWSSALISTATFQRSAGLELYAELTLPGDSDGLNYFALGWEKDQTTSYYYSSLASGFHFDNGRLAIYNGSGIKFPNPLFNYTYTDYQLRIVLNPAGGSRYLVRSSSDQAWTQLMDTSLDAVHNQDATLRLAVHQASHDVVIHSLQVRSAVDDAVVSLGTEESTGSCYTFTTLWQSGYSSEDVWAATPTPQAPSGLSAATTAGSVQLTWDWNADEDASFIIERCLESSCPSYTVVATVAAGSRQYLDGSAAASQDYRYRVRATKPSTCGVWQSGPSGEALVRTDPGGITDLSATPVNSRMVRLDWTPPGGDEDGFLLYKQSLTGHFVPIAELPAGVSNFTDTLAIEPESTYRYQLRAWRTDDPGPPEIRSYGEFSNIAEATTPAFFNGDGVCVE